MIKEIKYFTYIVFIFIFFFLTIKYYISDSFKKKVYRSINNHGSKINKYSSELDILYNDTNNIIEYIDHNKNKSEKKYKFWNLLEND